MGRTACTESQCLYKGALYYTFLPHCLLSLLNPKTYFMYHQFNFQQFCVLPPQCIYVFCVDLRTNSNHFSIQH